MDELEKIQQQIADLQKKAHEIAAKNKSQVIDEIKAKIALYGLTASDLGLVGTRTRAAGETKARKPVAVKYKHGDDTWTGRGMKPKWVTKYLADGGKLESLLVK